MYKKGRVISMFLLSTMGFCFSVFFRKMAPFRWPEISNDLMLAKEVAAKNPKSSAEWETIACLLSRAFSKDSKTIDLTG